MITPHFPTHTHPAPLSSRPPPLPRLHATGALCGSEPGNDKPHALPFSHSAPPHPTPQLLLLIGIQRQMLSVGLHLATTHAPPPAPQPLFSPTPLYDLACPTPQVLSVGLGLAAGPEGRGVFVSFVVEGSAAERAGVRQGDELVAVNGDPVGRGTGPRCGGWGCGGWAWGCRVVAVG